jgi:SAM-dependent methyltransferase
MKTASGESAAWSIRRRVFDGLAKVGLTQPALRMYEFTLAAKSALKRRSDSGGLPLPPARLRVQVSPQNADADVFLRSGREHADLLRSVLREGDTSIEALGAILDWGCGCGRVLRHWADLPAETRVYGCDINPKEVEWCRRHLDFADVTVNDIAPPLPYPAEAFDLVYALSVFTHLGEDLQHAWMRECRRVLKPGGFLVFSTMGEYYADLKRLTDSELQAFRNGQLVVLYEGSAGTNLCSVYHPRAYVEGTLAENFEPVLFRPAIFGRQDMYLFRAGDGQPASH